MSHTMHENSLSAHQTEGVHLSRRAMKIYEFMVSARAPMTDREIQRAMGFSERGMVQPRVSDLVKAKLLTEVDKVACPLTGKRVRRVLPTVHAFQEDEHGQGSFL